tara:strand:- start:500 stop:1111 length:612 start_codon:yes stop_codon:yes gene_type:complete
MNRIKEVLEEKGVKQTWLADRLNKSYNMVNSYVQNRRQPSLDDLYKIAEILGVEAKQLLVAGIRKPKTETADNTTAQTVKVPLLGEVACGTPIFAEENIEAFIPVSDKLIKSSYRYFILRASGDSMDDAGINDGDLVLIRQQQIAKNGDKVVALIDDEATIKEFQNNGNMIVLKPRSKNSKHQPIVLTTDFRIQGVVETVISL